MALWKYYIDKLSHRTPNAEYLRIWIRETEKENKQKTNYESKNYVLRFIIRPTESHYTHAFAAFNVIIFSLLFVFSCVACYLHFVICIHLCILTCSNVRCSVYRSSLALRIQLNRSDYCRINLVAIAYSNFIKLIVSLAIYSQADYNHTLTAYCILHIRYVLMTQRTLHRYLYFNTEIFHGTINAPIAYRKHVLN